MSIRYVNLRASPGLALAMNSSMGSLYPAITVTNFPASFVILVIRASIAAVPSLSLLPGVSPGTRLYASSMNNTPPIASLTAFSIFCPAELEYESSRVLRSRSTTCPFGRYPMAFRMLPRSFATSVFPVPGFPVITMCTFGCTMRPPRCARMRSIFILFANDRSCFFTDSMPINPSSFESASSMFVADCFV